MQIAEKIIRSQWSQIAAEYMNAQLAFYAKHPDPSRELLYSHLPPLKGKKLLDVGCGFGKDLAYYQSLGAEVWGIDISESMIKLAKARYPSLKKLSVQDYEKTNFSNDFFDVICSRYSLQYTTRPERAFHELHRILKPGGYLLAIISHPVLQFTAKRSRNYHSKELVLIPIYDGACVLTELSHTFGDYLTPSVLGAFDLLVFSEGYAVDKSFSKVKLMKESLEGAPDFFFLKMSKRLV